MALRAWLSDTVPARGRRRRMATTAGRAAASLGVVGLCLEQFTNKGIGSSRREQVPYRS
jgi:hypothetical protein